MGNVMNTAESDWVMLNKETGQEIECDVFLKTRSHQHRESTCISTLSALCAYIECSGASSAKVLSHILSEKDAANIIYQTYEEIAESSGVGISSVTRTFKKLMENGFLRKQRNGYYVLNPDVARFGSKSKEFAIIANWKSCNNKKPRTKKL
jgi:DNA-binding transcriptional ArsR family regulator